MENEILAILSLFEYQHLPPKLKDISKPFAVIAGNLVDTLPSSFETYFALRNLLQAKDCAVRAMISKKD